MWKSMIARKRQRENDGWTTGHCYATRTPRIGNGAVHAAALGTCEHAVRDVGQDLVPAHGERKK
jgi:hypothetical protein